MGRAPLIAVTGRRRGAAGLHLGPPVLDALEIEVYFTGYADHVGAAGGLPVHLPCGIDPRAVIDRVDGLVLSGGTDVDPARYGAATCATTPPLEPERDEFELALLDAALARDLPVLAICRGLQLVNVSRGGTLHAHLADRRRAGSGRRVRGSGATSRCRAGSPTWAPGRRRPRSCSAAGSCPGSCGRRCGTG